MSFIIAIVSSRFYFDFETVYDTMTWFFLCVSGVSSIVYKLVGRFCYIFNLFPNPVSC